MKTSYYKNNKLPIRVHMCWIPPTVKIFPCWFSSIETKLHPNKLQNTSYKIQSAVQRQTVAAIYPEIFLWFQYSQLKSAI
jgi:hypothetical protein